MLRLLRRAHGFTLATLLLFCGSIPLSLSALVHDADDVLCQPRFVVHDESAHRFGPDPDRTNAPERQHCAVCHWLQSLQSATQSSARLDVAVDYQHLSVSSRPFAYRHAAAEVPARAPPRA